MRSLLIFSFLFSTQLVLSQSVHKDAAPLQETAGVQSSGVNADDLLKIIAASAASGKIIMPSAGLTLSAGGVIAFGGGMILVGTVVGYFLTKRFMRGPKDAVRLSEFHSLRDGMDRKLSDICRVAEDVKILCATSERLHQELPEKIEASITRALTNTGLTRDIIVLTTLVDGRLPELLQELRRMSDAQQALSSSLPTLTAQFGEHAGKLDAHAADVRSGQGVFVGIQGLLAAAQAQTAIVEANQRTLVEQLKQMREYAAQINSGAAQRILSLTSRGDI